MMHTAAQWLIKQHFVASLPAVLYRRVSKHVEDCAACREHYARHLEWEALLPDAQARAGARMWRQAHAVSTARPERVWTWGGALVVAGAAAALLLFLRSDPNRAFVARGPATPHSHVEALVRAPAAPSFVPLTGTVPANSELAFRVDNTEGFARLALLLRDADGEVHYLYPGAPDQTGLAVAALAPGAALPDAFKPAPAAGQCAIVAIFSEQALSGLELERALKSHGAARLSQKLASPNRVQVLHATCAQAQEDAGKP